jgi:aspartate aminotransferase
MIARLSFTDFNGKEFMENFQSDKNIKVEDIEKFAPKIIEGTKRLKVWAESS